MMRPHPLNAALLLLLAPCWSLHLIVLVHGFSGHATDLGYLRRRLEAAEAVEVLCSSSNEGRTLDGVAAGGRRVAREVERFVAARRRESTYETISFVGNSLGGLYARYALAELFDDDGLVAGLLPGAFATTAAPHLGVADAAYGFALQPVAALGGLLVSQDLVRTANDLCGRSDVLRDLALEPRFLEPLRRFKARKALAALRSDFMVPFSSALFTALSPEAFVRDAALQERRRRDDIYCLTTDDAVAGTDVLARSLASLGWSKCAAALDVGVLPLAHNKLVALERAGIKAIASPFERTAVGQPVMDFLAAWLLSVLREGQDERVSCAAAADDDGGGAPCLA
mmetsp:Transcript_1565/g.4659  ORF Transcript_1565/g.4659 Transcript_1565/m.4659 type:complete len:341 (-) Transcript_1565:1530-2552(-)